LNFKTKLKMKTLKVLSIAFCLFIAGSIFAQTEKATIKTSAQCEMCKENIETAVAKVDGVKKATLDVKTKELKVKYDAGAVSLDEIRKAITATGYWADNMMPDKNAYAALPACCKPQKSCCASKSASGEKSCSGAAAGDGAKKCCAGKEGDTGEKKSCAGHSH
jgi:periplasmic mercuric ion binding protein